MGGQKPETNKEQDQYGVVSHVDVEKTISEA